MNRIAVICWSVAAGIVGFFLGIILMALALGDDFHVLEKWQVGLGAFTMALALALPAGAWVSKSSVRARKAALLLASSGALVFSASLCVYWHMIS